MVSGALVSLLVFAVWYGIKGSGWGVTQITGFKEGHRSIESLSVAADVVVTGSVKRIAGREPYYTGTTEDIGIPMVFYEIEVSEKLQGEPGDTIIVAQFDNSSTNVRLSDAGTPMEPGEQLLLFLVHRVGSDYGLKKFRDEKDLYVSVSDDNGVFEVSSDDIAIPREPYLFRDPDSEDTPEFTMDEIRAGIVNELPSGPR